MRSICVRTSAPALLLCMSAGTVFGQNFTYIGGAANGSWNDVANWQGGTRPTNVNGANNYVINYNTPGGGQAGNVVDRTTNAATPFVLNRIVYAATTTNVTTSGAPLRFDGTNPMITNNRDNFVQEIASNIQLAADIRINGTATNTLPGGDAQLRLTGVISDAAGARAVTIDVPNAMSVYIAGNNTYTGATNLNGGVLVIGHNNALGIGGDLNVSNSISAPVIRSADTETHTVDHAVYLAANTTFGATGYSGTLKFLRRFNCATAVGNAGGLPNTRQINLAGGRQELLELAGEVQLVANTKLKIVGDTAPVLDGAKLKLPKLNNVGSRMIWSGNITALLGDVDVQSATLDIRGNLGSMAARTGTVLTIGDGTTSAALIGRAVAGPRDNNTVPRLWLTNGAGQVNVAKKSVWQPGGSPGIMAVNGGSVVMDPGSAFAVTLNGTAPGNGDGFYSQALLEEGCQMTLTSSVSNERPMLGIDFQPTSSLMYTPGVSSYTIIDQDTSLAASLYSPADSFGYGGHMFMCEDGNALVQGAMFSNPNLPAGLMFQIDYFGGDTGNDVVISVVNLPTPSAASLALLGGMALSRRRRR